MPWTSHDMTTASVESHKRAEPNQIPTPATGLTEGYRCRRSCASRFGRKLYGGSPPASEKRRDEEVQEADARRAGLDGEREPLRRPVLQPVGPPEPQDRPDVEARRVGDRRRQALERRL